MSDKPNCYECKHRGNFAGSAHSVCNHPTARLIHDNPLKALAGHLGNVPASSDETGLNIEANYHGIRKGWFAWPFNFDPVWLENCDGFEPIPITEEA